VRRLALAVTWPDLAAWPGSYFARVDTQGVTNETAVTRLWCSAGALVRDRAVPSALCLPTFPSTRPS
jgi:hypothetical protein